MKTRPRSSSRLQRFAVFLRHPLLNQKKDASMHVLSKNDLNLADLETARVSRNQTQIFMPTSEVQKRRGSNGVRPRFGSNRDSAAPRRCSS